MGAAVFAVGAVMSAFEADLSPEAGLPRIRLNLNNGWSASIVLRYASRDGCHFQAASLAACPTGQWGEDKTELGPTEAYADELVAWLAEIAGRSVAS